MAYQPQEQEEEFEEQDVCEQVGVELEMSVHCSTIILCAEADEKGTTAGCLSAAKSIFVLLVTFAMQGILIWMIYVISKDPIKEKFPQFCWYGGHTGITDKRNDWLVQSHVGMSPQKDEACAGEDWSYKEDFVSKAADYFPHDRPNQGLVFGVVALMIWIANVVQEIASIVNYCGLAHLPDPDDENPEVNSFVGGFVQQTDPKTGQPASGKLLYLSLRVKALVVVVTMGRFVVAVLLLWVGVRFLSYTTDLKDFVLNSLALAFVLQVDDLAFLILVPRNVRARVACMEQPTIDASGGFGVFKCLVGNADVATFFGVLLCTAFAVSFWLMPFQDRYRASLCALGCGVPMCDSRGYTSDYFQTECAAGGRMG